MTVKASDKHKQKLKEKTINLQKIDAQTSNKGLASTKRMTDHIHLENAGQCVRMRKVFLKTMQIYLSF